MNRQTLLVVLLAVGSLSPAAKAQYDDEEITLFNGKGKASAYISTDYDVTIYLWDGKPVAYLARDYAGGFHVYGFNGKHLGWFVKGVIWDHDGDASCAIKSRLKSTELEPLKSLKELKPLKSLKELSPLRPLFSSRFGDNPCRALLIEGKE